MSYNQRTRLQFYFRTRFSRYISYNKYLACRNIVHLILFYFFLLVFLFLVFYIQSIYIYWHLFHHKPLKALNYIRFSRPSHHSLHGFMTALHAVLFTNSFFNSSYAIYLLSFMYLLRKLTSVTLFISSLLGFQL